MRLLVPWQCGLAWPNLQQNHWRRSWDLGVGRALVSIVANGTNSSGPSRKLKMAEVIDPADETEILTPGPDLVKAWWDGCRKGKGEHGNSLSWLLQPDGTYKA